MPGRTKTPSDVLAFAKDNGVEMVDLKFMDFVEALKGSTLEPNTEPGRNGGAIAPQKRILTRGISGNPEVIRFIHTITLSKDPLSKPAATPAQPESTGRPAPGAKPGRGKGKK